MECYSNNRKFYILMKYFSYEKYFMCDGYGEKGIKHIMLPFLLDASKPDEISYFRELDGKTDERDPTCRKFRPGAEHGVP